METNQDPISRKLFCVKVRTKTVADLSPGFLPLAGRGHPIKHRVKMLNLDVTQNWAQNLVPLKQDGKTKKIVGAQKAKEPLS